MLTQSHKIESTPVPESQHARCKNRPQIPTASYHRVVSFARFVASDRDKTPLIFKRFDELAARNLICRVSLRSCTQSSKDMMPKRCWRTSSPRNLRGIRKALMLQIWSTLNEYRESLLLESTLATLPRPPKECCARSKTRCITRATVQENRSPHWEGVAPRYHLR